MDTKCPNEVFYVWLVELQTICAKYGLETWFSPNNDIRSCLLDMKHGTTKNAFWDVNNKNYVSGISLFHLSYLITLKAYLHSQRTPNVQINFHMFYWSIYRSFVPNTGWQHASLTMIIIVKLCSTWSTAEVKTRLETLMTRNDVNGVSLCHLSYLITLMAKLCSRTKPNVQIKYFLYDWLSTDYLC
jgi:hypothetical protein